MRERVDATIDTDEIGESLGLGSKVGNCDGEIRELSVDKKRARVLVAPSGKKCSDCKLKSSCTASMDGYL